MLAAIFLLGRFEFPEGRQPASPARVEQRSGCHRKKDCRGAAEKKREPHGSTPHDHVMILGNLQSPIFNLQSISHPTGNADSVIRFMESPLSLFRTHWDHE